MRFCSLIVRVRAAVLCTAAALSCPVRANTVNAGAYEWTYSVRGSVSETDPATTNGTDVVVESVSPRPDGALEVPARLGDLPVTQIKASAFRDCTKLTSVILPASVVQIGSAAFSNCTALARVRIPSPEVKFGTRAFSGCSAIEYAEIPMRSAFGTVFPDARGSLREAVVAEGTGKLVNSAFANCSNLVSVTLPSTVTNIGASAFANCVALTDLTIPAGVRKIGSKAFDGCLALKSLTFEGDRPESFPSLAQTPSNLVVRVKWGAANWPAGDLPAGGLEIDGRQVRYFFPGGVRGERAGFPESGLPRTPAVSAADIVAGVRFGKARLFYGCALDAAERVVGQVSVKVGRTGDRGGSLFSVSLARLDHKWTKLARNEAAPVGSGPVAVPLGDGTLVFGTTADGTVAFAGRWGGLTLTSCDGIGGAVAGPAVFSLVEGFPRELPKTGMLETAYLPLDVAVRRDGVDGRKWVCPKGGRPKRSLKDRAWVWSYTKTDAAGRKVKLSGLSEELPDDPEADFNFAGLKLSYKPKNGFFKGSYTVYGKTPDGRMKSASVKVTGIVVNGTGYGQSMSGRRKDAVVWKTVVR